MKQRLFFLCTIFLATSAFAQYTTRNRQRQELSFYYEFGRTIYVEAVNGVADDRALSHIAINFRIANDALTFAKPIIGEANETNFTAIAVMRAELLDKRDVTVQRTSWRDTVHAFSYYETNDKYRFTSGGLTFDALPGDYTLVVTAEDGTSRQTLREQRINVHLRDFRKPLQISQPIFLAREDSMIARPLILGNGAEFGTPCTIRLEAVCSSGIPTVRYAILRMNHGDSAIYKQGAMSLASGTRMALRNGRCCGLEKVTDSGRYECRLDLTGDSLDIGDYALHVDAIAGADTVKITTPFHVVWSTQPLSLSDNDYAIESMHYILSDSLYDDMRSGNSAARKKHFDEYWTAHDPTPGTIFNERKAEYFRRVDDAYFTFRNPSRDNDDGMRTDRGKIFILFGHPTAIDRVLLPDGDAQETWTYTNNVHKKFTFVDTEKNGGYRLTEVAEMK